MPSTRSCFPSMKSSARSMHDYHVLAGALVPSARHQASSRAHASRQEQADFIHQHASALHACTRDSRPYRHTTHAMCTPAETTWPDPLRSIRAALYIEHTSRSSSTRLRTWSDPSTIHAPSTSAYVKIFVDPARSVYINIFVEPARSAGHREGLLFIARTPPS
jgi:hypothetical protein